MKTIQLEISKDGEIQITTTGFTGRSCLKASQFLKDALGKELSQELTPIAMSSNVTRHVLLCTMPGGHSNS